MHLKQMRFPLQNIVFQCRRSNSSSLFSWDEFPSVPLNYKRYDPSENGLGDGAVQKDPIVICHGMLSSSLNWMSIARNVMKETGRTVFVPDARNNGRSPHHPRHTYQDLASDLRQFLIDHNLKQSSLIGHSMGGRTVMLLSLIEDSDLIGDLIVVDATPIHHTPNSGVEVMQVSLDAVLKLDLEKVLPRNCGYKDARKIIDEELEKNGVEIAFLRHSLANSIKRESDGVFKWQMNYKAFRDHLLDDMLLVPERSSWTPFTKDTLFIGAEKSGYIPKNDHDSIRKVYPRAKIDYVSNSGHWIYVDNPVEFTKKVIEFLNR